MTAQVLILCSHNSARSVLAEAMLNHWARRLSRDVRAHSAGSAPSGRVNPLALEVLTAAGVDVGTPRSKSWDEFAAPEAPQMDLIITVCDNAAGEVCPVWPGHPASAHWGYADPSEVQGTDQERLEAFRKTLHAIRGRLDILVNLPTEKLSRQSIETSAKDLARS